MNNPDSPSKSEQYAEYLKSEHWRELRSRAYLAHGDRCHCCAGRPVEMHHLTYGDWYDVKVVDLIPLCGPCHERAHKITLARNLIWSTRPSEEKRYRLIAILLGKDPDEAVVGRLINLSHAKRLDPKLLEKYGIKITYARSPLEYPTAPYVYRKQKWKPYKNTGVERPIPTALGPRVKFTGRTRLIRAEDLPAK